MAIMNSLSLKSLRKNTALIPLLFVIGAGIVGAGGYLARLAIRNPDVSWNRKGNPNPNEEYATKQYKFYNVKQSYVDPRPKF